MVHELLRLADVSFERNSAEILSCINLNVRRGEVLGITGRRYAGKSSLLRVISGRARSNSGRIYFEDVLCPDWGDELANRSGVMDVGSCRNVYLNLSAQENVFLLRSHGTRRYYDRRRIGQSCAALFEELRIDLPINLPLQSMNFFERLQVSFAKAIADGAKLLLIDDVISRINEARLQLLYHMISCATARGIAVVLFDSNFEAILPIASRLYVLKNGRITAMFEQRAFDVGRIRAHIMGPEECIASICSRSIERKPLLEVSRRIENRRKPLFTLWEGSITGIVFPHESDIESIVLSLSRRIPKDCEIRLDGKRMRPSALWNKMGLLYDSDAYLPNLSLYENMTLLPEKNPVANLFIHGHETYLYCSKIIDRCFREDFLNLDRKPDISPDFYECRIITMLRLLNRRPAVMVYVNPEHRLLSLKEDSFLPKIVSANEFVRGSLVLSSNMDVCRYICDTIYIMLDEWSFVKYHSDPSLSQQFIQI